MKKTSILKKLSIVFFTIFIFSGLIKWIGIWPIDATVLFGLLTILTLMPVLILDKSIKFTEVEVFLLNLIILFSAWFYVSMLYSDSTIFVYVKAVNYLLILLSFIIPYFTINSKKDVEFYLWTFSGAGLITSIVVFYLYIINANDLSIITNTEDTLYPDYLAVGSPIGLTCVILFFNKSKNRKAIGIGCLLALILLTGRGPIFSLIIASVTIFISHFRFTKSHLRNLVFTAIIILIVSNYIIAWDGYERLGSRIDNLNNDDFSISSRVDQLNLAIELFWANPIIGIGLGAFGVHFFGVDMRSYPHNLLAEILVEQGLIGIILFLLFLYFFLSIVLRKLLYSLEPMFFILSGLFIYEFLNALKSSSIIEHRLLFGIMGICVASYKFLDIKINKNENSSHRL